MKNKLKQFSKKIQILETRTQPVIMDRKGVILTNIVLNPF